MASVLLPKRDIARRARPAGAHTTEQLRVNFEAVPKSAAYWDPAAAHKH